MPCHSRWSIGHRQLVAIQLWPALPPSSSSCTWNPLSTFHFRAPASMCSSVALFLCGLVLSTAVLAWQCCHHSFWTCDQASFTFFSAEPTPVPGRSSSIVPCWIFCLASGCLRFFLDIYSQKLAACRLSSVWVSERLLYQYGTHYLTMYLHTYRYIVHFF